MTTLSVSVIVVSQGRPEALRLCLLGMSQLVYNNFEVVVVADATSLGVIRDHGFLSKIKYQQFDEQNISSARNCGVSLAAGDIVAFIDDDAVPEPMWLTHLVAPFGNSNVDAAGGFVRGRNGISYQWKPSFVDRLGIETEINYRDQSTKVIAGTTDRAIKTPGTNCAFRRQTLIEIGGFDSSFRFYLDEVDVNMRIAAAGNNTAVVPLAEVHHRFLGSDRRFENRAPKKLYEVGASFAVFLQKYCPKAQIELRMREFESEQKRMLIQHLIAGTLEPAAVSRLLSTLVDGAAVGAKRQSCENSGIESVSAQFLPFSPISETPEHKVLVTRRYRSKQGHLDAQRNVEQGKIVSLFLFSRTALFHRMFFHDDGYWVQTGGIYGKSDRHEALLRYHTLQSRFRKEFDRVGKARFADTSILMQKIAE